MNDALLVNRSQTFADIERYGETLLLRQWARFPEPVGQSDSVEILHGQKRGGCVLPARRDQEQLMNAADVGATHLSRQVNFSPETIKRLPGV